VLKHLVGEMYQSVHNVLKRMFDKFPGSGVETFDELTPARFREVRFFARCDLFVQGWGRHHTRIKIKDDPLMMSGWRGGLVVLLPGVYLACLSNLVGLEGLGLSELEKSPI